TFRSVCSPSAFASWPERSSGCRPSAALSRPRRRRTRSDHGTGRAAVPLMGPRLILIRAPNWLGDTVMALPALRAVRAAHLESRIAVIGRWAGLLMGQDVADLVLPYPVAREERRRLHPAPRPERADLANVPPHSVA